MIHSNISFIGFMGSGKTTVGKLLAHELDYKFIDIDKVIEYIENKKIKDIFKEKGEKYFRELEKKTIHKIYHNKESVFACGGGVLEDIQNRKVIKENSYVIYLYESLETALKRLKRCKERPLLNVQDPEKKIKALLKKRNPIYLKNCDLKIVTDSKKPDAVVMEILKEIGKQ
jgi:shikimate kinase